MHRREGFTLIELLIVLVILGLLAAIATSFFWDAKDRAHVSAMQTDLRNLAAQQELYFPRSLSYAGVVADLTDYDASAGVTITINFADASGWAAQAQHVSYTGHGCGLFVGDAPPADGAPATEPGTVTCD